MYNVCSTVEARGYRTEYERYSWCIWSASRRSAICPRVTLCVKHRGTECNTGRTSTETGREQDKTFGTKEEKRKRCCCDGGQRMEIEKQTNKQSCNSETRGSWQVCCDRRSGLPLVSAERASERWIRCSLCAAICLQRVYKYNTSVCTSEKAGCVFRWGLFVSLFPYCIFGLLCFPLFSSFSFLILLWTLFSVPMLMHLWDRTRRLAFWLQAVFNAAISSLFLWLIQSEKSRWRVESRFFGKNKFILSSREQTNDRLVLKANKQNTKWLMVRFHRVGADIDTHVQKQNLWPPILALLNLFDWPLAPSSLPGPMEHWPLTQHGGSESLGSLTKIPCGLPSNRIFSEVSTLKAMTCSSDIPADTLCCHEYGDEYSTLALFFADAVWRGTVPPAVLISTDLKRCHML